VKTGRPATSAAYLFLSALACAVGRVWAREMRAATRSSAQRHPFSRGRAECPDCSWRQAWENPRRAACAAVMRYLSVRFLLRYFETRTLTRLRLSAACGIIAFVLTLARKRKRRWKTPARFAVGERGWKRHEGRRPP